MGRRVSNWVGRLAVLGCTVTWAEATRAATTLGAPPSEMSCMVHVEAIQVAYFSQNLADRFGRFHAWQRGECVGLALARPVEGRREEIELADPPAGVVARVKKRFAEARPASVCGNGARLVTLHRIICEGPNKALVQPGRYFESNYRMRRSWWRGWRASWQFTID